MNLPELPEGYFWRVTVCPLFGWPLIKLQHRYWRFFIGTVREAVLRPDDGSVEAGVEWLARKMYDEWQERERHEAEAYRLVGNYAPSYDGAENLAALTPSDRDHLAALGWEGR